MADWEGQTGKGFKSGWGVLMCIGLLVAIPTLLGTLFLGQGILYGLGMFFVCAIIPAIGAIKSKQSVILMDDSEIELPHSIQKKRGNS